jgi:hypothetical protein
MGPKEWAGLAEGGGGGGEKLFYRGSLSKRRARKDGMCLGPGEQSLLAMKGRKRK